MFTSFLGILYGWLFKCEAYPFLYLFVSVTLCLPVLLSSISLSLCLSASCFFVPQSLFVSVSFFSVPRSTCLSVLYLIFFLFFDLFVSPVSLLYICLSIFLSFCPFGTGGSENLSAVCKSLCLYVNPNPDDVKSCTGVEPVRMTP